MHWTSDPFPEIFLLAFSSQRSKLNPAAMLWCGLKRWSCRRERVGNSALTGRYGSYAVVYTRQQLTGVSGANSGPESHIVRWSVLGGSRKELLESLACTGLSRELQNGERVCNIFV